MAARLDEVRAHEPSDRSGRFDWTRLGSEFAQAFRDYGIDVEALGTAEAAERIRGRAISEELVAALDDWAMLRWRTDRTGARSGASGAARTSCTGPARGRYEPDR
jgi:hypothetical protein